jgi:hypothetical protein
LNLVRFDVDVVLVFVLDLRHASKGNRKQWRHRHGC